LIFHPNSTNPLLQPLSLHVPANGVTCALMNSAGRMIAMKWPGFNEILNLLSISVGGAAESAPRRKAALLRFPRQQ